MKEFEPLIGEWHGEGEIPVEPPMKISVEAKVERLGELIVLHSVGKPKEVPDSAARARRGLERPRRPRLQPALHRGDLR